MRAVLLALLSFLALATAPVESAKISITTFEIDFEDEPPQNVTLPVTRISNNCISFQVSQGTGCEWMCNYCANKLGTNNYYFTNDVCTYQTGGCVGNPQTGITYTCCAV
jgi:hypothetical protein